MLKAGEMVKGLK